MHNMSAALVDAVVPMQRRELRAAETRHRWHYYLIVENDGTTTT
jgi:hypothetical protein